MNQFNGVTNYNNFSPGATYQDLLCNSQLYICFFHFSLMYYTNKHMCHRIFMNVYMFAFLFLLFNLSNMCLHAVDRGTDALGRSVQSIDNSLDDFDTCNYVKNDYLCNTEDLCIIQLNIRGLCSKQSQLKHLIDNCMKGKVPDVVILCETWLTPFSPSVSIPGYDLCHKDCQTKRGGGVALLISNKIRYKTLNIKNPCNIDPTFESVSIEIELKNHQRIIVSSLY